MSFNLIGLLSAVIVVYFIANFRHKKPRTQCTDAKTPAKSASTSAALCKPPERGVAAAVSGRAQANISWFVNKHGRQLSRIQATEPRIDLMTAENWLMRDQLVAVYRKNLEACLSTRTLSYATGFGGEPELLDATSTFINRFFKPCIEVQPQHVVVGAGCNSILENLLYDLCDRDNGILIEVPYWGGFETSFVLRAQLHPVHVYPPLDDSRPECLIQQYERALRKAECPVKAVLFCNPHNPRGTIYPRSHIEALLQFCEKHDLHFISDEIYALSTFNTTGGAFSGNPNSVSPEFSSVLQADLSQLGVNPARVHMVYSISKDLGSSGLRLGFLITQAHRDLRLSAAIANYARVSTLNTAAVTLLLRDDVTMDSIVSGSRSRLRTAARVVTAFLSYHNLEFVPPAAGVFVWARLGTRGCSWTDESELNDKLEAAGVSLSAGKGYYATEPGWFRINFALCKPTMYEALRRVETALDLSEGWGGAEGDLSP